MHASKATCTLKSAAEELRDAMQAFHPESSPSGRLLLCVRESLDQPCAETFAKANSLQTSITRGAAGAACLVYRSPRIVVKSYLRRAARKEWPKAQ
jgi:hypothetical protein